MIHYLMFLEEKLCIVKKNKSMICKVFVFTFLLFNNSRGNRKYLVKMKHSDSEPSPTVDESEETIQEVTSTDKQTKIMNEPSGRD